MKRFIAALSMVIVIYMPIAAHGEYDPNAPLRVKRIEFCKEKPKGIGHFEPRENNEFNRADSDIYIYIDVDNCRSEREAGAYHVRLTMDVDIYYENGMCIYTEETANTFGYQSRTKKNDAYLWTKIDGSYLRGGEYKVEMTIHDEIGDSEAFALTSFTVR